MTSTGTPALVDVQAETSASLSQRYATQPDYQARPGDRPRWSKIDTPPAGAMCDECAQLQHETRGRYGPRKQPRERRTFPAIAGKRAAGPALRLCYQHAQVWHAKDDHDAPLPGKTRK